MMGWDGVPYYRCPTITVKLFWNLRPVSRRDKTGLRKEFRGEVRMKSDAVDNFLKFSPPNISKKVYIRTRILQLMT
jgi:hypothetical protein